MSLVKHSNWPAFGNSMISDLFDDDRFFTSPWMRGQQVPAVNVKETEKNFEIELAAPGYDKKDFNISIDNGQLMISAEKKEETEKKEDNYTRREFGYSSFSRSFTLPDNIADENIQARYDNGVLRLSLAKKQISPAKARKAIEVK